MQSNGIALHQRLADLLLGRLARASAWLFAGTIVGGLLAYVYQVFMGRLLSTSEYGVFSAIMALFAVLSAPTGTLMMVISRKVSEYRAQRDAGSLRHFHRSITVQTLAVGIVLLAVALPAAPYLRDYLKANNLVPIYLLGALVLATLPVAVNDAYLQALQHFSWLSGAISLRMFARIVFSAGLTWVGWGIDGAVGGAVVALVLCAVIAYLPVYPVLREGREQPFRTDHLSWRPVIPVLAANTAFAVMTQIDIVLVNHYFPAREASVYAAASILGKAVLYLPNGVAAALFPMVAENEARNRASAHLLMQAVGLTTVLCLIGALFYFMIGEPLVSLLYGDPFRDAGLVLKYFGFAMFPMALVTVAEYFLIAKGRVLFAWLFLAVAPVQVLAVQLWHSSLSTVVAIIAASGSLVAVVGYAILWRALARS